MKTAHRALWLAAFALGIAALTPAPVEAAPRKHTVTAGQSLWGIARSHHVDVDTLGRANGMREGDLLKTGQVLTIPDGKTNKPPIKQARKAVPIATQKAPVSELPALSKSVPAGAGGEVSEATEPPTSASPSKAVPPARTASKQAHATHRPIRTKSVRPPSKTSHKNRALHPSTSQNRGHHPASATGAPKSAAKANGDSEEGDLRLTLVQDEASDKGQSAWVLAKPPSSTQVQKDPEERGGVNPCMAKDPGWGVYHPWSRAPSMGQMIAPQQGGLAPDGGFDVIFHFHGHEAVRKEWVKIMRGPVLVGIDLGIGSGAYQQAFRSPDVFKRLVESVERAMANQTGNQRAHVRKVGLSSWSAGYGAIGEIIGQAYGQKLVDSVVLLDGLHSGYGKETLDDLQLGPFLRFAQEAAAGRKLMFVSHSSIIPPGYASTTETANYLIQKLGGRPQRTKPRGDPWGLDLISRYDRGSFHVRGYSGNDKMDHCAHIGLYRDVLKVRIAPRWRSPRGYPGTDTASKERSQVARHEPESG